MGKQYIENTGDSPKWVNGILIAPGEGREVEIADEAPAVVEEPQADPDALLHELLGENVEGVKSALPGLSDETLKRLQVLETEGKARKGVLEALADAQIALADAKLQGDDLGDNKGPDSGADSGAGAGAGAGA
jgi:hypothetical protein